MIYTSALSHRTHRHHSLTGWGWESVHA